MTFLKILDIFENFGPFGQLKNHSNAQKSIKKLSDFGPTDRRTDIVNYRVALTRLKNEKGKGKMRDRRGKKTSRNARSSDSRRSSKK